MRAVLIGLLFLFQIHCGGTANEASFSSGGGGQATGGIAGGVSKGISVEGNVSVPVSSITDLFSVSKSAMKGASSAEGEVCCKRYDGTTVANGAVDSSGEIFDTIVSPASLDATGQVLCETLLEDGRTLLNHYDLSGKVEGDRVRADVSVASTVAAEQVLLQCGSEATFENMEACAVKLKKEDLNPQKLFEKYRDKMEGDAHQDEIAMAYQNLIEALEAKMAGNFPPKLQDIREILKGNKSEFSDMVAPIREFADGESTAEVETAEVVASGAAPKALNPWPLEEDIKKFFELMMQTPYGLDKTRDASEQGNLGRPLMGDPYGQDKEADSDGNKNQERERRGRPFRYEPPPAPPPEPEPAPEPTPEPPPPIILEAPVNTQLAFSVMSGGWNLAITPETLGGVRYQSFAKSVSWSYLPDPSIAGFRVYDKAPGESAFRLLQTVDLSKASAGVILSSSGSLVNIWLPWSGGTRVANQWPPGTYESYVAAFDAEGKEGPPGAMATAVNLGEIQWLRPTEGQVLGSYYPTFQWSNVWPLEIQTSGWSYPNNWGWTEMTLSEQGAIYNLFHGNVGWFTTSWKELLQPGRQYYIVVQTGGFATINGVKHSYFGYSRLVGFTSQ